MTAANGAEERPPGGGATGREITRLEWVVAALGALLVFGSMAYLAYQAFGRDESPPDVRLVVEEVRELQRGGGYVVTFRAFNEGQSAAAELGIEGELHGPEGGGTPVETSEATLDHLPAQSNRAGGLFFTRDPRSFELRLRAKGYHEP